MMKENADPEKEYVTSMKGRSIKNGDVTTVAATPSTLSGPQ